MTEPDSTPIEGEVVGNQVTVVADTLGNRISHSAKAIAVLLLAVSSLAVTLLATIPSDAIPTDWATWINTGLGFVAVGAAWLTANGPKVGTAIDTFGGAITVFRKDVTEITK